MDKYKNLGWSDITQIQKKTCEAGPKAFPSLCYITTADAKVAEAHVNLSHLPL